ncbi:MAG TPA: hypothetical protein VFR58_11020, partial [Flavisolibacter sp.]|nr:hypothetical protein [Flavisolibacter sp.]
MRNHLFYLFALGLAIILSFASVFSQQPNKPLSQTAPSAAAAAVAPIPSAYGTGLALNYVRTQEALGK